MATDSTHLQPSDARVETDTDMAGQAPDFASVQLAAATGDAPIPVKLPQGNQKIVVIPVHAGQTIELPTDSADGLLAKLGSDGNLAIVVDGRTIILQGYAEANADPDHPVKVVTDDGDPVDVNEVIVGTNPDVALDIQTAAGPAAAGAQGNSDANGSGIFVPFGPAGALGGLHAVGVLGATDLHYKLIDDKRELFPIEEEKETPANPPSIDFFPKDPEVKDGRAVVSDEGLPGNNADSDPVPDDETNDKVATGTFVVSDPDVPETLTVTLIKDGSLPDLFFGGVKVEWSLDPDGHTLHGQTGGTDAITIHIEQDGDQYHYKYEVDLLKPLDHPVAGSEDEVNFNVTVKVTDSTNLSDTAQLAIQIEDDSPVVSLNQSGGFSLQVDETVDGKGGGDADENGSYPLDGDAAEGDEVINAGAVATAGLSTVGLIGAAVADVSNLFTGSAGADGEKSHAYDLQVIGAGLTSLHDTATGKQIELFDDGANILGRVVGTHELVFALHIDEGTGDVTMAQYRAIDHGTDQSDPANPTEADSYPDEVVALGQGVLQVTYSITDKDDDTASQSVDIGNSITFDDDGPNADLIALTVDGDGDGKVVQDETAGVQNHPTQDPDPDASPQDEDDVATRPAEFDDLESANPSLDALGYASVAVDLDLSGGGANPNAAYGSDGPGTTKVELTDGAGDTFDGDKSNLSDTETGRPIFLYTENGLVIGRVADGSNAADPNGAIAFAISIDGDSMDVAQYRAIKHPDTGSDDESVTLGLGLTEVSSAIYATITVVDKDGDAVVKQVPLDGIEGNPAIVFQDDGPTAVADVDSVMEDGPLVASGNVITGKDGGLDTDENGDDGNADTLGVDGFGKITWVDAAEKDGVDTNGSIAGAHGTLTIDADGNYKYELDNSDPDVQKLAQGDHLTETFTYTVTDGDGDPETTTLTITINGAGDPPHIDFFPKNPDATNGFAVVSDEGLPGNNADSDPVPDDDTNSTVATGTFLVSDPDVPETLTVTLIKDASLPDLKFGGETVSWSLDPDGHTLHGQTGGTDAITITITDTGDHHNYTYEVDLLKPLDHPDDSTEDEVNFNVTVKVTDSTNLSDTALLAIQIEDDSPTITPTTSGTVSLALDETVGGNDKDVDANGLNGTAQDGSAIENDEELITLPAALTIPAYGDVIGAATADASKLFDVSFGADGPAASDDEAFSLKIINANTGLKDTATGDPIILVENNGVIEGVADDGDAGTADPVVFALTIAGDGTISMAQYRAIDHGDDDPNSYPDEVLSLGGQKLAVALTATDSDGDHVTAERDIGGSITFDDDGPTLAVDVDGTKLSGLVTELDETVGTDRSAPGEVADGNADDAGPGLGQTTTNITGGLATLFTVGGGFGSDGPGTDDGTLGFVGIPVGGLPTNLEATDGGAITLFAPSDTLIQGKDGDGNIVFTIAIVDVGGFPQLQTTLFEALVHDNNAKFDETAQLLVTQGLVQLQYEVTRTDGDGDQVTQAGKVDLISDEGSYFAFDDDGPNAAVKDAVAAALILDETRPVGTDTDGVLPNGLDKVTVDFSSNFETPDYGSDGAGTTKYSLDLTGTNVASGLYALDPSDTETVIDPLGKGDQIVLNQSGDMITGSVGGTDYFTITIDPDTGKVTFEQLNNIWHGDTGNDDDTATLTLSSADLLKLVQTVTDGDDDKDTASINLGAGVFKIQDDGPDASISGTGSITLVLDETRPVGTETDGDSAPAGLATVQGNFTSAFNPPDYGSDGAGSATYTLSLAGTNVLSGLFALDLNDKSAGDGDGIGKGAQIVLNQSGNTITGSVGPTNYFTITIVPATGVVTFTQINNIWHTNTGSDDDTSTLNLLAANLLQVVQTVTDADGDTDTASVDIGQGVFQIEDDGPKYISPDTLHLENKGVIGTSDQVIAQLNFVAGTDGVNNVVFNVPGVTVGVTSGVTVVATDGDGHQLKVGGQLLYLYYGGAGGDDTTILVAKTLTGTVGFTIDIDPVTGTYAFNPEAAISNGTEVTATDLTGVGGGNVPFKLLIDVGGTTQDVALTTKSTDSVNTDNDDIGISQGQTFQSGESIRFDLVNGLKLDDVAPEGYSYDGTHNTTTRWKETVLLTGNSSQNADFVVSAIVADSDNTFFGDGSGESLIDLATSNIHIYDKSNNLIDPLDYAGLGISLTDLGNTIEIDGIKDGMSYEIVTDDAHKFNAVGVDAVATTDTFSLSFFSYGENNAGTSVDLSYNVVGTDGDGDPANGTIDVSLYPDASSSSGTNLVGTALNDTFLGTQGADTITGAGGADRLAGNAGIDSIDGGTGNDTIIGGSGNDNLTGGANSDTFVYETLVDGKDSISDFDIAAPGSGGDKLDIGQVLDHAGNTWTDGNSVGDAVTGGYLTFTNSGGFVQVNVDIDGSAGNSFAPTAVAVLTNVAFVSAAQAATDLNDNIVVG